MVLTIVTMVADIFVGYTTGSMALLADGFHMATHAGALAWPLLCLCPIARLRSSYTFGTGKVGKLAGFASAQPLMMIALGIAVVSAGSLVNPVSVAFGDARAHARSSSRPWP